MSKVLPDRVRAQRIAVAKSFGLSNVDAIANAAIEVGFPFYAACALFEKESMGRNCYGHDKGGALSGFELPVTKDNYAVFRWLVFEKGQVSNGVGPAQITFKGYFLDMEKKGLKPYDVHDNMVYGLTILLAHYAKEKTWQGAGTRYNGAESYGIDLAKRVNQWRQRFGISGVVK